MIFVLLVTSNKAKQLLHIRFLGNVQILEFQSAREDIRTELKGLSPGFRYWADFSQLESMGLECVPEIGGVMEMLAGVGVGMVVRFIPDPSKDIGMNILAAFHYPKDLQVINCATLGDVARSLNF